MLKLSDLKPNLKLDQFFSSYLFFIKKEKIIKGENIFKIFTVSDY